MKTLDLNLGKYYKLGWESFKKEFSLVVSVVVVSAIVLSLLNHSAGNYGHFSLLSHIASLVFSITIAMGIIRSLLKIIHGKKVVVRDFYVGEFKNFFWYTIGTILYCIITLLGLICFIVPGIILNIRLKFFSYLIVEKKLTAIEAFKESFKMTKGYTWDLFLFGVVNSVLVLIGFLTFFVGLIVAIPVVLFTQAYIYGELRRE
jgi:uncharacterized membrane protein